MIERRRRGWSFWRGLPPALTLILALPALADSCRISGEANVDRLKRRLEAAPMLVTVCPWCEIPDPVPLRIHAFEVIQHAPETVDLVFYELTFPVADLHSAERDRSGPLAEALHAAIEAEYEDTTGYPPDDPILIKEKRDRFTMMLELAREDVDRKSWSELEINGEAVNAALLFYPLGENRYKNLGVEIGCDPYSDVPNVVSYQPVRRTPDTAKPPDPYLVDITDRCYDGSCPQAEWETLAATPWFDEPRGPERGQIPTGETLLPVETVAWVSPGRAVATRDFGRIFEGDPFYLLDAHGEGFYSIWHYGDVFVLETSGIRRLEGDSWCERKQNCWAAMEAAQSSEWWSRVKRENGELVWVRDAIDTAAGVLQQ